MNRVVRARGVFTPEGTLADGAVELDANGRIAVVRQARPGDPVPLDGLLVPGLVNAHLHLELSALAGRVQGGDGLSRWVLRLVAERAREPDGDLLRSALTEAATMLSASGTVAVSDISNAGNTGHFFVNKGVSGVVQHELLTLDARRLQEQLRVVGIPCREDRSELARVVVRPAPHALYSTAPALIKACVERATWPVGLEWRPPASIHVGEDREELRFLDDGTGAWATLLDRFKVDWRWWRAPGTSPVAFLEDLGVLGPNLLLVHGVHLDAQDRRRIAQSGSVLCLCPRSNLHIGGELPDVPALLRAQVPLCLGTDSLASCPDLDVLGEIPTLGTAFPEIDATTWLRMATEGGARALGLEHLGAIVKGRAPGLLLLEGIEQPEDLVAAAPRRQIIAASRWP